MDQGATGLAYMTSSFGHQRRVFSETKRQQPLKIGGWEITFFFGGFGLFSGGELLVLGKVPETGDGKEVGAMMGRSDWGIWNILTRGRERFGATTQGLAYRFGRVFFGTKILKVFFSWWATIGLLAAMGVSPFQIEGWWQPKRFSSYQCASKDQGLPNAFGKKSFVFEGKSMKN